MVSTLSSPALSFAELAAPPRKALGRMLLHPISELRCSHHAGLHRDVSEVRRSHGLLAAICWRGEAAEHGDNFNHDGRPPSPRWALAPLGAVSSCSLTESVAGKMLSYAARASRMRRARSRSDLEMNRMTSPTGPGCTTCVAPARNCARRAAGSSWSRSVAVAAPLTCDRCNLQQFTALYFL